MHSYGAQKLKPFEKTPYDARERLFEFACLILEVVRFLHTRGPIPVVLSYQLLDAGMSAGANYEEADDGSSLRDSIAKKMTTLRDLGGSALGVGSWELI